MFNYVVNMSLLCKYVTENHDKFIESRCTQICVCMYIILYCDIPIVMYDKVNVLPAMMQPCHSKMHKYLFMKGHEVMK